MFFETERNEKNINNDYFLVVMNLSVLNGAELVGEFLYRRNGDEVGVYFISDPECDPALDRKNLVDLFTVPPEMPVSKRDLRLSVVNHYLCKNVFDIATPLTYVMYDPAGAIVDDGLVNGDDGLVRRFLNGESLVDHLDE